MPNPNPLLPLLATGLLLGVFDRASGQTLMASACAGAPSTEGAVYSDTGCGGQIKELSGTVLVNNLGSTVSHTSRSGTDVAYVLNGTELYVNGTLYYTAAQPIGDVTFRGPLINYTVGGIIRQSVIGAPGNGFSLTLENCCTAGDLAVDATTETLYFVDEASNSVKRRTAVVDEVYTPLAGWTITGVAVHGGTIYTHQTDGAQNKLVRFVSGDSCEDRVPGVGPVSDVTYYTDGAQAGASISNGSHIWFYPDALFSDDPSCITVPVAWGGGGAHAGRDGIDITWTTLSQINTSRFNIYRDPTSDGDFSDGEKIATVPGAGTAHAPMSYRYTDTDPDLENGAGRSGQVYYRVSDVDVDGRETFHEILTATLPDRARVITVYPNPATQRLTIRGLTGDLAHDLTDSDGPYLAHVFNMAGHCTTLPVSPGGQIDITALPGGYYVLQLDKPGGPHTTHPIPFAVCR